MDHVVRSALEAPSDTVGPLNGSRAPPTQRRAPTPQTSGSRPSRDPAPASSRYVLPSFVERTSYGVKEMNPYNKLFEERIIFLGVQIDDASANDVIAQLITLESLDPDRDITMYINSPGGSMTSMMAIYDTMQFVQPEIQTCLHRPGGLGRRRCCSPRAPRASGWPCRTPGS